MPRGIGEGLLGRERWLRNVFAEDIPRVERMGQRLDSSGVEFGETRDKLHDLGELSRHPFQFGLSDRQPGQHADFGDFLTREAHGPKPGGRG